MTLISKNVYTDKLDNIVNKYNNTYHIRIKIKPVDIKIIGILTLVNKVTRKILNFKLVIVQEYQNTKTFLLKDIL